MVARAVVRMIVHWGSALCLAAAAGCYDGGEPLEGLARTPADDIGPTIVWDLDHRAIPDIPFPNDVGTRSDRFSATGRRVNVSRVASTRHETRLRTLIDQLDGFGTFAPLWIRFDGRIDVLNFFTRQNDTNPRNDAVYLVNITPTHPDFGKAVPLDFGSGPPSFPGTRFPVTIEANDQYFPFDPRAQSSNLLFETEEEDLNGDGVLQPEEDTDHDGVLDHPNLWGQVLGDDRWMDPYQHLITFYELETDTLLMRPRVPLDQLTTYAAIVTRRVVGEESQSPVRSPFAYVHHLQQTDALAPLVDDELLEGLGLTIEDVAFTWTFTTQSVTKDFEAIRAGLYGRGPLGRLATEYPGGVKTVPVINGSPDQNPYTLPSSTLVEVLNDPFLLTLIAIPPESAQELAQLYRDHVDYFVFAELESPQFIQTDVEAFQLDWQTGEAEYSPESVFLNCAVPTTMGNRRPPFPVVLYNHGSGSTRLEMLGFSAAFAEHGFATCAIDAYGHGLMDNDFIRELAQALLHTPSLQKLADMVFSGRARDLNSDGFKDSGSDFWTADMFHTRDATRQTVVDWLQTVRVLRSFGRGTMPVDVDGDGQLELAGDFNGDGIADLGGEQPYVMTGQSLGGIVTALVGAVEPTVRTLAPAVPGAGLVDVATRSSQRGMLELVWLKTMGTMVVGQPWGTLPGRYLLEFNTTDTRTFVWERRETFARVPGGDSDVVLEAGDSVEVHNLDNGEMDRILVRQGEGFRLQVATDMWDRLEVRLFKAGASQPFRVITTFEEISGALETQGWFGRAIEVGDRLVALQDGLGLRRGTPALRRLTNIAQMIVEPADPANYARYYRRPLDLQPDGAVHKNVLVVASVGDMNVPINTGITLGRLAGALGSDAPDPRYGMSQEQVLLQNWVAEGLEKLQRFDGHPCRHDGRVILFDADDASQGADPRQGPSLAKVTRPPHCSHEFDPNCLVKCEALPPLRATVRTGSGVSGLRLLYQNNTGAHSYRLPDKTQAFDYARYQINQIAKYFASGGREIIDDPCLADPAGCP